MPNFSAFPARDHSPPTAPPVPDIPATTILDYLDTMGLAHELSVTERKQFVSTCQAYGLNPWKREVYATLYGEGSYRRFSVIVGYETYLKRAERTGRLDGWSSRIEGEGASMKAVVEIHRRDWSQPLIHEVYFVEAVQKKKDGSPSAFWSKMPRFQLKKVCISQAFRLCFPDELGGLPYDASELPDVESIVAAPPVPPPEAAQRSEDHLYVPEEPQLAPPSSPEAKPATATATASSNPSMHFFGYQDPFPEEPQSALYDRLSAYLDNNAEAFTDRHHDWIIAKAQGSRDRHSVLKMLAYAEKVVRNASAVASA